MAERVIGARRAGAVITPMSRTTAGIRRDHTKRQEVLAGQLLLGG
jgi:hypothetical protein